MINRILIRIKVVQMLYSYLLTRSEFRILPPAERNTRDARYAYKVYLQTLLLILKLTGQKLGAFDVDVVTSGPSALKALAKGDIAGALAVNCDLREAVVKHEVSIQDFAHILQYLVDEIAESAIYKEFSRKRKREINDEVDVWAVVIETIFARDDRFKDACRRSDEFTIAGFNRGLEMAIATIKDYSDIKATLFNARRSLSASLEESYRLYVALMALPIEITRLRREQLETARDKYLPTADDLNPNLKFIDNKFVEAICDESLEKEFSTAAIKEQTDYYLVKKLLDDILASQIYQDYMESKESSLEQDCEFWRNVMKDIIFNCDELSETLENKSIFWNDDLNIVGQFVLKTIRRAASAKEGEVAVKLMPMFKDEEDAEFGERLFVSAVDHYKEYRSIIDRFINKAQWDTERIAMMDIVVMVVAITEIMDFPLIPIPVSFNEYIEIANYYSTPRSGQFINGTLYSVINYLKDEGRLHKSFDGKHKAE